MLFRSHFSFGGGIRADVKGYQLGVDVGYLPFDLLGSATLFDLRVEF